MSRDLGRPALPEFRRCVSSPLPFRYTIDAALSPARLLWSVPVTPKGVQNLYQAEADTERIFFVLRRAPGDLTGDDAALIVRRRSSAAVCRLAIADNTVFEVLNLDLHVIRERHPNRDVFLYTPRRGAAIRAGLGDLFAGV